MKIIVPEYILTPNKVLSNLAVAFDKTIDTIAPLKDLQNRFPKAEVIKLQKNSLLMPGLINSHVHLEFSANKTTLKYGNFIKWLYSVIQNREELVKSCQSECIDKALDMMLQNGITTIGAISSNGLDLPSCAKAKQNVVFFNELIGSQANMADALFDDFNTRLDASKSVTKENFYPAIAIHSPYSVHHILIKKALEIAKNEKLKVTTHFMESVAEREWLDKDDGEFKKFFKEFLNQEYSINDAMEFLKYFNGIETLFTHVTNASLEELNLLAKNNHTVIHCPISNRLLGNPTLNIKELNKKNINWVVATDGLSSNYTLDLFEEMKISLFMHSLAPLNEFAKALIEGVTSKAAKALGLNSGEIAKDKDADMIVLDLDTTPDDELAIHLILQRYNISKVFIQGELVKEGNI